MVVCFVLISKDKTSLWITLKPTADLYALSCVFYLSRSVRSDSATLRTILHQTPLSMGYFRQEFWSGLPFLPPGDFCNPGTEPTSPMFPALADRFFTTAAAAKSLQSSPTLCDPINGSPPDSPIPGILQAWTLEWVAISSFSEWKWKVKVKSCLTPPTSWTTQPIRLLHPWDFPGKSTGVGAIAFAALPLSHLEILADSYCINLLRLS